MITTSWFGIYAENTPSVVALLINVNPGDDNPKTYVAGFGVSPVVISK